MLLNQAEGQTGTRIRSTVSATAKQGTDSLDGKSFSGNRLELFNSALHISGHKSITHAAQD